MKVLAAAGQHATAMEARADSLARERYTIQDAIIGDRGLVLSLTALYTKISTLKEALTALTRPK